MVGSSVQLLFARLLFNFDIASKYLLDLFCNNFPKASISKVNGYKHDR